MAKAKKGSKTATKVPAAKPSKQLTVIPEYPPAFPSFYSNYASVTHTASELFIDYCLMAMPYMVNLEEGQLKAPVISRVILPPEVASGLIKALESQLEKQRQTAKEGALQVAVPQSKKGGGT